MRKIRVVIADDSVVVRRVLSDVLKSDPEIEVVGVANNGRVSVSKVAELDPDIVILDLEMPEMDGLQALSEIRRSRPRLPVIMYSTLTQRGATATLDALALGASDYLTKPSGLAKPEDAIKKVQNDLIPKIKAFCDTKCQNRPLKFGNSAATPPAPRLRGGPTPPVNIIAIGTSTGGPNALADLMPSFPTDFNLPIVIVQHMPPIFTRILAERLSIRSSIPIHEATDGEPLLPGHAYIAPGDYHMIANKSVRGVRIALNQDPQENSCRPAVDVLFRSVAETYGAGALGVVMTGIGQDGLLGSQAITTSGGTIMAQDEASSVAWGMPSAVVKAGLVSSILPINLLGQAILARASEGRTLAFASRA